MLSLGPCRSSTGAVSDWFFRSPYDSLEVSFKRQGASVIRQGKLGTCLFVIASGEVTILIDGKPVRDLCKNAYFDERSLLSGENRSATIEAVSSTGCCGSCSTPLLELRTPSSQSRKRMAKFQKNWLVSVSCWLPTITRSSCSW